MKKRTQIDDVLVYLQKHKKGITSRRAFELFGCTRLSSCIHDLRHDRGLNIVTLEEKVPTRYGRKTKIARYVLED